MSTDPSVVAWTLVGLGALTMLLAIFAVKVIVNVYHQFKFELDYMKHPRLVPYDPMRKCEGPHSWVEVDLVLRGLPPGRYTVCKDCGSIINQSELMVSAEVLQQMKEATEILGKKEAAQQEIVSRINAVADSYVTQYINRTFVGPNSEALKELVAYAFEAQALARDKVMAEIQAQDDLGKRYANWPSKIKGNA